MNLFKPAADMDEYVVPSRAILSFAIGGGLLSGVILVGLGSPFMAVPLSILAYILAATASNLCSRPRPGSIFMRARSMLGHELASCCSSISTPGRYLWAATLSVLAIGLNLALDTDPREHAYISVSAPIIFSALLFGYEAAVFALLVACVASLYFFIPPRFNFSFDDPREVGRLCEFSAFVLLSSFMLRSMFEGAATQAKTVLEERRPLWYREDQADISALNGRLALTEMKYAEARARYEELRHRVKNEFQAFSSLAVREAETSENPERYYRWVLRLRSAAELHRLLDEEADEFVPMASYLSKLSEAMRQIFDGPLDIDCRVDPGVGLDRRRARNIGLIYMEAAINAQKYAFPQNGAGVISVQLRRSGKNLLLSIANDGVGFDPVSARPGYGFTLIKDTAASLGGVVTWENPPQGGARLNVTFEV